MDISRVPSPQDDGFASDDEEISYWIPHVSGDDGAYHPRSSVHLPAYTDDAVRDIRSAWYVDPELTADLGPGAIRFNPQTRIWSLDIRAAPDLPISGPRVTRSTKGID